MTLDEVIKHCDEIIEKEGCDKCGEEHEQLKNWLKELKRLTNLQAYKFEDLKVGMWIFDTKPDCEEFTFIKITKILSEFDCEYLYHDKTKQVFFDNMVCHAREFEEGRFFPVTIAMEYQE